MGLDALIYRAADRLTLAPVIRRRRADQEQRVANERMTTVCEALAARAIELLELQFRSVTEHPGTLCSHELGRLAN